MNLSQIIKARRVGLEKGNASSSQDLLSHLLTSSDENGKYLTEMEIANNILLLLFAGHDTSAVTITLLMKRPGEHPDVYDKVLKGQLCTPVPSIYIIVMWNIKHNITS